MATQRGRPVSGVVLLDKPGGLSSNAALQIVKRLYRARKAGHTGSLDPLASGLLPLCLGEATKFAGILLNADKSYRFGCRLGVTTTTGDAEGQVTARRPPGHLTRADVEAVLARFTGEIRQIPPMYSALKHQGRPLYRLARQGLEVERQPRTVTIHTLRLLTMTDDVLECEVRCSKGTYIRTLAADLGETLGCGAHIVALRRTAVGHYDAARMVTLEELKQRAEQGEAALDAVLLAVDSALVAWPVVVVPEQAAHYLAQGQSIWLPRAPSPGPVRLYRDECFLGLGEVLADGRIVPRRLVQAGS
jgi:tRNA pseudouridine55 synthase